MMRRALLLSVMLLTIGGLGLAARAQIVISNNEVFAPKASSGGAPTPTLIQHVASSTNPVGIGTAWSGFQMPVQPTGSGDTVLLAFTYPHGKTISSITDSASDTISATGYACQADAGTGNNITRIYVLQPTAGTTWLKVAFSSTVIPFNYVISEYNNIVSTTAQGTLCTAAITPGTGGSIGPGSFTPTNNNGTGGNLLWNYDAICGAASGNPTNWVPATNWTLLHGDIIWTSDQGFPEAGENYVQTTSASISPSITATGDTADCFNSATVALKIGTAGIAAPTTIHVAKIIHESSASFTSPGSEKVLFPTVGNLRVVALGWPDGCPGAGAGCVTNVTSSDGCSFTKAQHVSGADEIWYAQNCSPDPSLSVTLTWTGSQTTPQFSFRMFDVENAAASSFANETGSGTVSCGTSLTNAPSITPSVSAGLTIDEIFNGNGPITTVSSPTGAENDLVIITSGTDIDLMDNADFAGHAYFSSNAVQNWDVTKAHGSDTCSWEAAVFQ